MNVRGAIGRSARYAQRMVNLTTLGLGRGIPVGGRRYQASSIYVNQLSLRNVWERWMDRSYEAALLCTEGAFVDVGANIGQTMLKILALEPQRSYIGFEPQLGCSFYIDDFIRRNALEHYQIFPFGLANRNGCLRLFRRMTDDGMASSTAGFMPDDFYALSELIYVARGDEIMNELGMDKIGVIKIDVEGGELEVLEGFQHTIARHAPIIFFEALPGAPTDALGRPDHTALQFREHRCTRLEELIRSDGYRILAVRSGDHLEEVFTIDLRNPMAGATNEYVAVPPDLLTRFLDHFATT